MIQQQQLLHTCVALLPSAQPTFLVIAIIVTL